MKGDSIGDGGIFDIQGDDRILIEIYSILIESRQHR